MVLCVARRKRKRNPERMSPARRAVEASKALGIIVAVEPASRRADGSPRAGPGQVYATPSGMVFHPGWCRIIGGKWDTDPGGVLVIAADGVGLRRECKSCVDPLTT